MDIENTFLVQKIAILVIILRTIQIAKKPKKQHQAAVTKIKMFLKRLWALQSAEVFFLIAKKIVNEITVNTNTLKEN